jgi:uncharacterized protein (TIGR02231 family)
MLRLTAFVILSLVSMLSAVEIPVPPTEVVLYPGLCEARRHVELRLEKGVQEFRFGPLPVSVDRQSIRLSFEPIEGVAQVRVRDVRIEEVYSAVSEQPVLRELEKRLEDLLARQRELADRETTLKKSIELIDSLNKVSDQRLESDFKTDRLDVAKWDEILKFTESRASDRRKLLRETGIEARKVLLDIAVVEQEIARITSPRYAQITRAILSEPNASLQAEKENLLRELGKVNTGLYLVAIIDAPRSVTRTAVIITHAPGAEWSATYDFRVDPYDARMSMVFGAEISQITGEDWTNVSLSLSTSAPQDSITPPPPPYWILNFNQPRNLYNKRSMAPSSAPAAMKAQMAEPMEAEDAMLMASAPPPVYESKLGSVLFPIKAQVTLPSRNETRKVIVDEFEMSGKNAPAVEFFSLPEAGPSVYLFTDWTNSRPYPLQPGPCAVYLDGDFSGRIDFPGFQPGEGGRIPLGIEKSIKVKKELVKKYTEQRGKQTRISYKYRVTLKNFRPAPVTVNVEEYVPVSRTEGLEAKEVEIVPSPISTEEEKSTPEYQQGRRRFKIDIPADGEKRIDLEYYIQFETGRSVYPLK